MHLHLLRIEAAHEGACALWRTLCIAVPFAIVLNMGVDRDRSRGGVCANNAIIQVNLDAFRVVSGLIIRWYL